MRTLNYDIDVAPLMELYRRGEMTARQVMDAVVKMARTTEDKP